uniref:Uncharacterized protein n=1 Tax=Rhizophora mucronata TaxID=61149 RepID=A0A2P2Q0Z4_RHIMU
MLAYTLEIFALVHQHSL